MVGPERNGFARGKALSGCHFVLADWGRTREGVVGVEPHPQLDDAGVLERPPALEVDVKHHNLVLSDLVGSFCTLVVLIRSRVRFSLKALGDEILVGGSTQGPLLPEFLKQHTDNAF